MFKKLLLKVYNATVSEITLQASSGSVDYEFAKTVKEGFKVQSSKFYICRKMYKTSSQELQLYSLWTFLKAFIDNEDSKLLKQ